MRCALLGLGSVFAVTSVAEEITEYTAQITAELAVVSAEAAEVFVQANAARERNDLGEAERLYRDVLTAAPDFYHARRRLCSVLARQGRRGEAIGECRKTLESKDDALNRSALLLAIARSEEGKQLSQADVDESVEHAGVILGTPDADVPTIGVTCQAVIFIGHADLLRKCATKLSSLAPDAVGTHYTKWTLSMYEGRYADALGDLERAKAAGLDEEVYVELKAATEQAQPWYQKWTGPGLTIVLIWLVALAALLGAGYLLSQAALRASRRPTSVQSGASVGFDATLRRAYKSVLWLSCAYYFVSIPLMLLATIAVAGGVIYGFLAIGRIPIKLALIVVAIAGVTLWAGIKSIFIRSADEDPGEKLDTAAHPRFQGVLHEVAAKIGTRPVDNVYLTPGTDLAVMERGGMLRQMRGATERCLILGVAVLDGMKMGPFKAVLAHEYGHFSNKDTAGGGFALAVRRSLVKMANGLAEGGAAVWYNPAWIFLNGFFRVFLRISQGASRLQEVLADRWAAFAYGAKAFEGGLRHVIERSIIFNKHTEATLNEVINEKKAMANFYSYRPAKEEDPQSIAEELDRSLNAEPSPYDSHPAPAERFQLVHGLGAIPSGDLHDENEDVWSLFNDRDAIELQMTHKIAENLNTAYGVSVAVGA